MRDDCHLTLHPVVQGGTEQPAAMETTSDEAPAAQADPAAMMSDDAFLASVLSELPVDPNDQDIQNAAKGDGDNKGDNETEKKE